MGSLFGKEYGGMIADDRLAKKDKFLEYFKSLPVQKLAAGFAGISEDTVTDWKKEDSDFAYQIELRKSEWAKENASKVRSKEWLLERVLKDHFAPRQELTGKDGEDLNVQVVNYEPRKKDTV